MTPQTFNNDFFTNTEEGLSLENAYKYFLRLTGGTISGNLNVLLDFNNSGNTYLNNLYIDNILVNSTANELNYNAGITLGIASNNKVLTLNNLGNVSGINILEANELTALSGLSVEGGHLTMSASSHIKINSTSDYTNTTDASIYSKGGIYIEKSFQALQNVLATNFIGSNISLSSANLNNFNTSSTNATVITASSFTNQYDMYLRKPSTTNGQTLGIGFHITTNDVASQTAGASLIFTRTGAGAGYLSLTTSAVERLRISETGIVSIYNTTNSTTPTTGALVLSGGLGVGGHVRLANNGRVWLNSEFGFSHGYSTGGTAEIITYNNGTAGSYIGTYTSHNFGVATAGVIRIGVDTSGNVNIVNHNGSTTGLRLNNTLITATATELNYLDFSGSYVLGVCEASKAVVLDSSRNVSNINSITSDFLTVNTSINSSNASANFRKLTLQSLANNFGVISVQGGNNSSPFFGSTDSILYCESSNLSPICFELNVSNLTSATSTNSLRFGTTTANDMNLFTNQVARLNIASTGAVKVLSTTQTSSPTTGALLVDGGIGCNKAIWANNNIISNGRLRTLNAGIGLEHTDNTIGLISFVDSGNLVFNQGAYFGTNTNHNLIFQTNELERMRINAGGNVSIGNTNNTYALDITGDVNCSGSFRVNGTALPTTGDLSKISGITNGIVSANKAVVVDGNKDITGFNKITTNTMDINDDLTLISGNLFVNEDALGVGGNITCQDKLTCNSFKIQTTFGNILQSKETLITNTFALGTASNTDWFLYANDNSTGLYIKPNGRFGFNTNQPAYTVDIDGDMQAHDIYGDQLNAEDIRLTKSLISGTLIFGNKTDIFAGTLYKFGTLSNDDWLLMANDNQSGLYIKANGRIGIRENNPDYELEVDGSIGFSGSLYFSGTQLTSSVAELNVLDGFTGTTTQLNYLAGTTLGTITASKVITVDSSSNINSTLRLKKTASGQQIYFENGTSTATVYHTLNGDLNVGTISANDLVFQTNNTNRLTITSAGLMNILGGWQISGSTVSASATELNYLDFSGSYVLGVNEASKAVVLDASRNTSNINNITMTGQLTMSGVNRFLLMRNSGLTNGQNVNFILGRTNATNEQGEITFTYSTTANASSLSLGHFGSPLILNVFQSGNVSIGNTSNAYKLDVGGSLNTTSLFVGGSQITATASELNYLDFSGSYTLGVNEASKAVVLDASRNTSNINNISVNNIGLGNSTDYRSLIDCGNVNAGTGLDRVIGVFNNGTTFSGFGVRDNLLKVQSGGANGIAFYTGSTSSSVGTEQVRISPSTTNIINTLALNGTSITATATELNVLDGYTGTTAELNYLDLSTGAGTAEASKAMVLDTNKDIVGIRKLGLTGIDDFITLTNNGATTTRTTIKFVGDTTSWECGSRNSTNSSYPNNFYIYGNVGFRFVIDPSGNVDIVNHNGSTTGLELGGVLITASATELNYVDVVAGAGTASKALVLDANRDINNIRRISTANISLNNATTYPTPLHCGSTAGDKIIGVFNNTTTFYGFGANDNQLKLQTGGGNGFGFYTGSTGSVLGNEQMRITATSTSILQTTASTNSTSGALIVSGGVGIAGNVNLASSTLTGTNCVASLRAVQLGATSNNFGVLSLLSNSASYISPAFSASSSLIYFESDNLTQAISFEINVANGTGGTSTNPVRLGTVSNNDLVLFTNKVARMTIASGGRMLYNTSSFFSNERISLNGSVAVAGTSDWVDGSYQITGSFRTSDSANEIQIQQTTGGDAFIGTKSNNRFCFMTNNTRAMNIDTNQRVGIGTSSPSTLLHVSGSVSTTVSTGTYGQATETAYNTTQLAPITFNNSLRTSSSIYCGGSVFVFSDRRIKKDIEQVSDDYSDTFFDKIDIIKYRLKNENETSNKYLGVVAQEVFKNGYTELINMAENENMKKETDDDIEGIVMNVDYAKIALLCVQQIKKLKKELKEIKDFISTLEFQEV